MESQTPNPILCGDSPLLISIPHSGTRLTSELLLSLNAIGLSMPDTDWFVDRLYAWAPQLGAGMITAAHSRYVIDLNRPPDDSALYVGAGTGLVPTCTFSGEPIYHDDKLPDESEKKLRLQQFWQPYHESVAAELEKIRLRHGYAIMLDAHSIPGEVPRLFQGQLSQLNLGSNDRASASSTLIDQAMQVLDSSRYTAVLDGRFKGGYITRKYGRPALNTHVLQLEISQRSYMQEFPPVYQEPLAHELQSVLKELVDALICWKPDGS